MKVALLGHSFVRDLEAHARASASGSAHAFAYFWKPGSCFNHWLNWPSQLRECITFNPDIIYIVLGSNSIVESILLCETKQNAKSFYKALKEALPSTLIIQCEVESRYLCYPNSRGTPSHTEYHRLRRRLNQYLCSDKTKDFFCNIGGPGRLDDEKFYKSDKIHLNSLGLQQYWSCINNHLDYIIANKL